jgi:hypothetical protein
MQLLASLNPRGVRESQLLERLKELKPVILAAQEKAVFTLARRGPAVKKHKKQHPSASSRTSRTAIDDDIFYSNLIARLHGVDLAVFSPKKTALSSGSSQGEEVMPGKGK